ncbi:hypothetical protein FGO68_gene2314 [Halteria grandinella]|uniref:RING-type domain-containing protein n=1 Tax=Halteria grandinella TaxID=5974 RepID=A0A8J8T939_HALGN|nr:hypothetical protein FGO68_gene2314 [Halteria grandinella]
MSYRLKRKKFKCLSCKSTFSMLVQTDDQAVSCDNCGKGGSQAQDEPRPPTQSGTADANQPEERKRFHLVDGAYRMIFSNKNASNASSQQQQPAQNYHTRVNVRDRSLDNFHGDANFQPSNTIGASRRGNRRGGAGANEDEELDDVPPLESVYRTPNNNERQRKFEGIPRANQMPQGPSMNSQYYSTAQNARRPPSGRQGPQMTPDNSSNLPRIDSRQGMGRPPPGGTPATNPMRVSQQGFNRNNIPRPPSSQTNTQSNTTTQSTQHQSRFQQQNSTNNTSHPRMQSQQPTQNQRVPNHTQSSNTGGGRARSTTIRIGDNQVIHMIEMPFEDLINNASAFGQAAQGGAFQQFGQRGAAFNLGNLGGNRPQQSSNPDDPMNILGGLGLGGLGGLGGGPGGMFFMRRNNQPQDPNDQARDRLENMLGSIMRSFNDIFSGHQFLRMRQVFESVSPDLFMNNFNSNFQSGSGGGMQGEDFFEMVRRISEQEAEARAKKKRAKGDAVSKLPIVKIETKHCKKNGNDLEPPSCTVCCDAISLGSKGMFMPCGHIYHPDCLQPWLKEHNTCPVCRYELPTEDM